MKQDRMILSRTSSLEFDDKCFNRNVCVIGSPGSGKTHSFVKPNILQVAEAGHSMVVSDTKGVLSKTFGRYLEEKGYEVKVLDLISPDKSCCFDPFINIINEHDVLTFCDVLVDESITDEPFWDNMAKYYIQALTAYICLEDTEYEKKISSLIDIFLREETQKKEDGKKEATTSDLFEELEKTSPDSFACRAYRSYSKVKGSEITDSSILSSVSEKLMPFMSRVAERVVSYNDIDMKAVGDRKTALFVGISDNDRSLDKIASLFFTQLLSTLVRHADLDTPDHRLPIPVDLIIDDFGTHTVIPNFDSFAASVRSRNISLTIILQSVTQLYTAYGNKAKTIISCCDTQLYFGGADMDTVGYIAKRADSPECDVMNMPRWKVWVLRRGMLPLYDDLYCYEDHPSYSLTADSDRSRTFTPELIPHPVRNTGNIMLREVISYDLRVTHYSFEMRIKLMIGCLLNEELRPRHRKGFKGCIAYSTGFITGDSCKNIICLFERRKELLDGRYYHRYLTPVREEYHGEPDLFVLVSFSGFTKEEEEYALRHRICLVDRKGFTDTRSYKILNLDKFIDLKKLRNIGKIKA